MDNESWICNVLINLLSDFVFVMLGLLVFWLINLFTSRIRLLKFFGIAKSKRIAIYISNLQVIKGGSTGIDGRGYSYQGTAVAYEEFNAANHLRSLFNYILPTQVDKPNFLDKLLITDIAVEVAASPLERSAIEKDATIISVGLPPYNLVSRFLQDSWRFPGEFDYEDLDESEETSTNDEYQTIVPSGIAFDMAGAASGTAVLKSISTSGSTIPSEVVNTSAAGFTHGVAPSSSTPVIKIDGSKPYSDTLIGFVQRKFDADNNRNVFYIGGLSEHSTAGCVYYLRNNWKRIADKYKDMASFLVLLKINEKNNHLYEIVDEK